MILAPKAGGTGCAQINSTNPPFIGSMAQVNHISAVFSGLMQTLASFRDIFQKIAKDRETSHVKRLYLKLSKVRNMIKNRALHILILAVFLAIGLVAKTSATSIITDFQAGHFGRSSYIVSHIDLYKQVLTAKKIK
jgi:hypothetical protein